VADLPIPLVSNESATNHEVSAVFSKFDEAGRPVPMLYRLLANSPALLRTWYEFATELRDGSSSPRRLRELIIMRVAHLTGDTYEWQIHRLACLGLGITEQQLDELPDWQRGVSYDSTERIVLQFADELTLDGTPGAGTMAALAAMFPPSQVIELLLTAAFYSCVSRVIHAFDLANNDADGVAKIAL
jgi:alkylhydroperoxidase family enzyme